MKTKKGINDNGGTSGSQPQSVSRIDPVFFYPCTDEGDIFVYLAKAGHAKIAIATFDDGASEHAFAMRTITSNSKHEAVMLIREAEKSYYFLGNNPFTELLEDSRAMAKLSIVLTEFFDSGE